MSWRSMSRLSGACAAQGLKHRETVCLGADEIVSLWRRLDRLDYPYGPAFQLMLVLGQPAQ